MRDEDLKSRFKAEASDVIAPGYNEVLNRPHSSRLTTRLAPSVWVVCAATVALIVVANTSRRDPMRSARQYALTEAKATDWLLSSPDTIWADTDEERRE